MLPPLNTTYIFNQLIDHNNPDLGTFQQRYWTTWEFYETGGPIIFNTPGETNAEEFTGYLTNKTINGQIAQQHKGATIVLEHRYYGTSTPFGNLSVESLKYHTIEQAIEDLVFFANNVVLPFPGGDKVSPAYAPWVLLGGSYSGALTAFTLQNKPGVFQAGYASSAVVESIVDFWQYFEPERLAMPKNCTKDVAAVIAHWDAVHASGNATAFQELKEQFGMGTVTHDDDAVSALRDPLYNWQVLSPTSGGDFFYSFCDALEVDSNGKVAPASGSGLAHALPAWANYNKATDCLGTYNTSQSFWTDESLGNDDRSWMWIVCTAMGFLQESAPVGHQTLVSRLIQPIYDERQCQQMFPSKFSSPPVPNVAAPNIAYGGFHLKANRLFVATATRDPWNYATLSAPGSGAHSTAQQPIVASDAFHCSDLITANNVDPTVLNVQKQGLKYIGEWLAEWKAPGKPPGGYY
ncbi:serine carboxypeptidase S28-domain-containing protein [Gloeopeniophorella convolvens]|nr:serine carboxypeptidase S28-domain-containing protein [Gloeopeniophorella convolvens]